MALFKTPTIYAHIMDNVTKRAHCRICLCPEARCICTLSKAMNNRTRLIIWQHPSEHSHPKGTAQLLQLCLKNSEIVCGEVLSPCALGLEELATVALLYPETPSSPQKTLKPNINTLILLDGTWRKSRKILHLNPWINDLTRYILKPETSNYRIRKAESEEQLSSFEAGAIAISQLDNQEYYHGQLDSVFEAFVSRWESYLPSNNQ
ncbi:MAG: DTW domain-containing protein YfiP [Flavobacteriales bacterium]|jgi:DTW domain-containing protein YfiP